QPMSMRSWSRFAARMSIRNTWSACERHCPYCGKIEPITLQGDYSPGRRFGSVDRFPARIDPEPPSSNIGWLLLCGCAATGKALAQSRQKPYAGRAVARSAISSEESAPSTHLLSDTPSTAVSDRLYENLARLLHRERATEW